MQTVPVLMVMIYQFMVQCQKSPMRNCTHGSTRGKTQEFENCKFLNSSSGICNHIKSIQFPLLQRLWRDSFAPSRIICERVSSSTGSCNPTFAQLIVLAPILPVHIFFSALIFMFQCLRNPLFLLTYFNHQLTDLTTSQTHFSFKVLMYNISHSPSDETNQLSVD